MSIPAAPGLVRRFLLLSSVAFGVGFGAGGATIAGLNWAGLDPHEPSFNRLEMPAGLSLGLKTKVTEAVVAAIRTLPVPSGAAVGPSSALGFDAAAFEALLPTAAPATGPLLVGHRLPPPDRLAVAAAVVAPQPDTVLPRAEFELRSGETVLTILTRAGIQPSEAHVAIGSLSAVANLRKLQVGQRLVLELEPAVDEVLRLARLEFPIDPAREVHLVRAPDGSFTSTSIDRPLRRELVRIGAEINDSVYVAARVAGLPPEALGQMIKLLSWDVDFQRDVHPGDRFEAVYEQHRNENGEVARTGELLFAGLDTRGREIEAYRFTDADGHAGYYDREGRAVRKWLLKTPVDGARLSSQFGPRRHPVLGYTRMHKGIDFAAATGTPVLAAGDGVIEFAGRNKGYGKYLRLKHNGEYATAYAHLSRFGSGIRRGRRVKQGEVIGYVGSTGMSTGPHLHYEVLQSGQQVNPLAMKAGFGDQLRGAELTRFLAIRAEIDRLRHRPEREELVAQRVE